VNTSLGGLHDTEPTAGSDTLTLNATDSFGNSATQQVVGITVNGAPSITAPTTATVTLAGATAISGVSVTETGNISAAGAPQVTVTLTDTHGLLSVTDEGGTVTGEGTTSLTITSSFSVVNSDLSTLSDTDSTSGADTIKINATDSFGNVATQSTIAVTAGTVPVITVPGTATVVGVNKIATISGISISEAGSTGSETFNVTLTDSSGVLGIASAHGATVGGTSTDLTVSGTLTEVNAALATLTDTDGTAGSNPITVNATDSFGGVAAQQVAAVTANGVPSISVPGAQTLSLGVATAISGISVSESGSTGAPETFTAVVSDTNGDLSFTANGSTVTGNGTDSVTISGSLADVDAALASATDTDSTAGADTIKVNATDSFGNVATQQTIAVNVTSGLAITVPGAQVAGVGKALTISGHLFVRERQHGFGDLHGGGERHSTGT
jgi:hypothetical protein